MSLDAPPPLSRFVAARDGLRLHALDYQPSIATGLPVVCLPGLARTAEDFDLVARALVSDGRRVLALDYRGRGLSQWDPNWRHYDFDVEQDDILTVFAEAKVERAVFVGTSRGGIHTMRLALARPELVGAAVLNDIGPRVEMSGLLRIKRYVGKLPPIASLADAIALMRMSAGAHFSGVSAQEWATYARQTFVEGEDGVRLRYDPELSHTMDAIAPDMEEHSYWDEFAALARVPVLAIRAANSDILSREIFDEMAQRHTGLERLTVAGQGHAPLLLDAPTIARIADFLRRCP